MNLFVLKIYKSLLKGKGLPVFVCILGLIACKKSDYTQFVTENNNPNPKRINLSNNAEKVWIKGDEFIMGSDSIELKNLWERLNWNPEELEFTKTEQPAHRVKVNGFWMQPTLVTVGQYREFAKSKGLEFPAPPSYGWNESFPMVRVTWEEAKYYCECQGGRLPTEAEWEFAARGGKTGLNGTKRDVFVWGNELPLNPIGNLADQDFLNSRYYDHNNFHGFDQYKDGFATASPVRAFSPNAFGIFDMAGNVLEWCEDWYEPYSYAEIMLDNPKGPETGTRKVLRGGAFDTSPTITRISRRLGNYPDIRHEEKGFRCVIPKK